MSLGGSPADKYGGQHDPERLRAKADADRAARLAGHKPLIERLLERLRPHRKEQRQLRRTDALERKVRARENLQNYKPFTGDEPGPSLGGF